MNRHPVNASIKDADPKMEVSQYWESEVCGIRGIDPKDRRYFFWTVSEIRYSQQPYIAAFAAFSAYRGRKVLEIGVGAGADFERWVDAGADVTGIDLTRAAIEMTRERLDLRGVDRATYSLQLGDAEALTFPDRHFDLVYSYGVLHHTPDMEKSLKNIRRILKISGELKIMIYGVPCWTGIYLWFRYGLGRGRPMKGLREVIYDHLESPGTKAFCEPDVVELLQRAGFGDIRCTRRLAPSDLLSVPPSTRYRGALYSVIWKLFPRPVIRVLGDKLGLFMFVVARRHY